MKIKTFLTVTALVIMINAFSQIPLLELAFTAIDNTTYIQPDSIRVMNRTQGDDTVLYWPDTVLILEYQTGIEDIIPADKKFRLFQNYPNPAKNQTTISLFVPEKDYVSLIITDLAGRRVISTGYLLDKGFHTFSFTPGDSELYFFTVRWKDICSSIKILTSASNAGQAISLEYTGCYDSTSQSKLMEEIQGFSFHLGDTLLYIGYAGTLQSGLTDNPETGGTYTFQFAFNIPCPGMPAITYEGQDYNTVQIFSYCWLKENLNAGEMIPGFQEMQNNGVIEKYCYANDTAKCNIYGGLYQWHEMMQYTTAPGGQGICPPDWHIPSDEEWKILEGSVDSQYGIGDSVWNNAGYRGHDAGLNLKSTGGWGGGGNGADMFGYSGLPGGSRIYDGNFDNIGYNGYWWSSTAYLTYFAWIRGLDSFASDDYRGNDGMSGGFSVRCIRNY